MEDGDLWLFSKLEFERINVIKDLIERYIKDDKSTKPLCIAVFGPPGSGKSFTVMKIKDLLTKNKKMSVIIPYTQINLTQVENSSQVYKSLKEVRKNCNILENEHNSKVVPFVFVDEFDAPHRGIPLGWLNWFLAPMQDGEFGQGEELVQLPKAVYFFAGGTSETSC